MKPSVFQATQLRSEYQENPLGIDVSQPRLSWKVDGERRGARQTAYQILAWSSFPGDGSRSQNPFWDSGQVSSDQSVHVEYRGPSLTSSQRITWQVRIWDETGQPSEYSPAAWWEMGLLERSCWQGEWVGSALSGGPQTSIPCPYLRKPFYLESKPVAARLYVTALGLYEVFLNGERVGEDVLTPGWTDFNCRVYCQAFDVTALLRQGENVLTAILGDGWYCGHIGWFGRQNYGDRPKFLAQLNLVSGNGDTASVSTDPTWKTSFGPLLESDMLMGEAYDARLEFPGWNEPGFDDSGWSPVTVFPDPGIALDAQKAPGTRRIQELQPMDDPREITAHSSSRWIFDFGQNMVGWVRLKLNVPAANTIRLRFGEMLDESGGLYTANLRTARQTDYYTTRGAGEEVYQPRFTCHGFRYVELSGFPGAPSRQTLTGVVLHTSSQLSGKFACSDSMVNQLQHNILWGQKGNFVEAPTDCPQRDERLGWTGDAQAFMRTAAFNMDVAGFFTKWLRDLADAQGENGAIPPVAPKPKDLDLQDGGPGWADAGIICPWTLYLCYGDLRILEESYPMMVGFMDYLSRTSPGLIRCDPALNAWSGFGDWLSIQAETPKELIGSAYFAYSAKLMAKAAAALGYKDDQQLYQELFEDIRQAYLDRFVTPAGLVAGHTQTAYTLSLFFDLLPEGSRQTAAQALVNDIRHRGNHLSTGFLGTIYLPFVLTETGNLEIAYHLLKQKDWPSWLYPVAHGATTIWERWDGWTEDKGFQDAGMNSFNHYAFGSIGAWLYQVVAGIDVDPARPGYKQILLKPRPGGGLTWARGELETMYGSLSSHWKLDGNSLDWQVKIPANSTATAWIPAGENSSILEGDRPLSDAQGVSLLRKEADSWVCSLESGSYHFLVLNQ